MRDDPRLPTSCDRRKPTLIPEPFSSDVAFARFHHLDVRHLSAAELWAEQTATEAELAWRLTVRRRPRVIFAAALDRPPVDDVQWLMERVRQLRAEQMRRSHRVA